MAVYKIINVVGVSDKHFSDAAKSAVLISSSPF